MPNHIKNRLEFKCDNDQFKEILKRYGTLIPKRVRKAYDGRVVCQGPGEYWGWYDEEKGEFEYGYYPEDKKGVVLSNIPDGLEKQFEPECFRFPDFKKVFPMPKALEATFGQSGPTPPWYNWRINNWGTKWNSYSISKQSETVYTFETAWSGVPRIIEEISLQFPSVEILYEWSDEDTGCNCGVVDLKNGIKSIHEPVNNSDEAYELAFKLRPEYRELYEKVDGEWKYIEEE